MMSFPAASVIQVMKAAPAARRQKVQWQCETHKPGAVTW
jgi:hypothetical protein